MSKVSNQNERTKFGKNFFWRAKWKSGNVKFSSQDLPRNLAEKWEESSGGHQFFSRVLFLMSHFSRTSHQHSPPTLSLSTSYGHAHTHTHFPLPKPHTQTHTRKHALFFTNCVTFNFPLRSFIQLSLGQRNFKRGAKLSADARQARELYLKPNFRNCWLGI